MSKYEKFDEWKAFLRQLHQDSSEPTPGAMLISKLENERLKRNAEERSRYDDIPSDTEGDE